MSVQDWFALALRIIGVATLIPGLGLLLDGLLHKLGYFQAPDTHTAYYLIYGAAQVIAGIYLISGAPLLVGLVYTTEDEYEEEDEGDAEGDAEEK